MISISNTDYSQVIRLLRAFSETKGKSLREQEQRRQAVLLRRKLEKKTKHQL